MRLNGFFRWVRASVRAALAVTWRVESSKREWFNSSGDQVTLDGLAGTLESPCRCYPVLHHALFQAPRRAGSVINTSLERDRDLQRLDPLAGAPSLLKRRV